MEGFVGEHGTVLISGILAVMALAAVIILAKAVGNMDYIATIAVVGG